MKSITPNTKEVKIRFARRNREVFDRKRNTVFRLLEQSDAIELLEVLEDLESKQVDQEVLIRAMKKAVQLGIFSKVVDDEIYLRNWEAMEEILKAALEQGKGE